MRRIAVRLQVHLATLCWRVIWVEISHQWLPSLVPTAIPSLLLHCFGEVCVYSTLLAHFDVIVQWDWRRWSSFVMGSRLALWRFVKVTLRSLLHRFTVTWKCISMVTLCLQNVRMRPRIFVFLHVCLMITSSASFVVAFIVWAWLVFVYLFKLVATEVTLLLLLG